MEILLLAIGLIISASIISKAITENNKRNLKYNPEFQKQFKKVRDFLWMQDNLYDFGNIIDELEQELLKTKNSERKKKIKGDIKFWRTQISKYKKEYYQKYPKPDSLNFPPLEEWPLDLKEYSKIVEDKGREVQSNKLVLQNQ